MSIIHCEHCDTDIDTDYCIESEHKEDCEKQKLLDRLEK